MNWTDKLNEHLRQINPYPDSLARQRQYEREKRWVYSIAPQDQCDRAIRALAEALDV